MAVPIHRLDAIALFGPVLVSPGLMELCIEAGVTLTYLNDHGRLIARVDAPRSGNVLLRREQFRRADRPEDCVPLARSFVAGKLHNARNALLRAARESKQPADVAELNRAASILGGHIEDLGRSPSLDSVRGHEGDGARTYFGVMSRMIRRQREHFAMNGRSRRPPLDPVNALLSFTYALMVQDCVAALTAAGLDPDVGFLHGDRPGRPSLALDLVEEFRTLIADRLVLALINRLQVGPNDFVPRDGGAVELTTSGRKTLVQAYVTRKREELTHPLLETPVRVGQLPFIQAKLLARHLRGDSDIYLPCVVR
ncbi:MAG TPA: type I-C CRISPR-associated endonuclease Cas1c [Isosphaeraceae bacterium]|jgi:CRISPR-associated protein Cas1